MTAPIVTVYSAPNCVQCRFTKRELEAKGLEYNEIDVTIDDEARKTLQELGITQLPAVRVEQDGAEPEWWSGFRVEKLRGLAA